MLPFENAAGETRGPRRVFLDWQRPVLHSAAEWLRAELGSDMGDVLVALPGARAARRLRELLARAAAPSWTPPRILTQGELIDALVVLERPAAARLTRTLVWERALAGLDENELARLHRSPHTEGPRAAQERLRLAETVRALHGELAPEGRDFAALARETWAPELEAEAERWQVLASAQARYRALLMRLGEVDPHEGRAQAIAAGAVERSKRVLLVAVADMNHLLVELVRALGERVTVLVGAPPELADGFDALGRLQSAYWRERDVPLELADWRVAEKPVDQAETLRAVLDEWHGELAPAELEVGVADEGVVPYLERQLEDCGVRARRAAGTPLERTRPLRLLRGLARYLARRGFAELAALARDPDLAAAIAGDPDAPARFDRYYLQHLPRHARDWLGAEQHEAAVRAFHAGLERGLGALTEAETRPLAAWAAPIRLWLEHVYAQPLDESREPERVLAEALRSIGAALGELEEVPASLELAALGAAEALELLLRTLRGLRVPPPPAAAGTVELLGWLDLPLADAPALILTGFNEGRIPQALGAHAFLPDSRRAALGLPSDAERVARDVYAATVILKTRARRVFVSARRSGEGDPLVPSRLAFHRPAAEVPERVARFLPHGDHAHAPFADEDDLGRSHACPRIEGRPAPERLRVSAFRLYLSSPYLFYLERVLGLETVDDRVNELDPRRFGTLAHEVLEDLARGPHDSSDAEEVARFLAERLRARAAAAFGPAPLPAVGLQLEQLEHRLRAFARAQAAHAAEGWRIHAVEWKPPTPVRLDVDGQPLELAGTLDRVDRNLDGRWCVLDYKTGDRHRAPRDAHLRRDGAWLDLQLPLYRLLARELVGAQEPVLGYAWIGKEDHETGFFTADFRAGELDAALDEARRIVRCIRAGQFEETGRAPYDEIFRAIFGQSTLGAEPEEARA